MRSIVFDDLNDVCDSRYTLVVASAKRARELLDGAVPSIESQAAKPVTLALEEIKLRKVHWYRTKEGIK